MLHHLPPQSNSPTGIPIPNRLQAPLTETYCSISHTGTPNDTPCLPPIPSIVLLLLTVSAVPPPPAKLEHAGQVHIGPARRTMVLSNHCSCHHSTHMTAPGHTLSAFPICLLLYQAFLPTSRTAPATHMTAPGRCRCRARNEPANQANRQTLTRSLFSAAAHGVHAPLRKSQRPQSALRPARSSGPTRLRKHSCASAAAPSPGPVPCPPVRHLTLRSDRSTAASSCAHPTPPDARTELPLRCPPPAWCSTTECSAARRRRRAQPHCREAVAARPPAPQLALLPLPPNTQWQRQSPPLEARCTGTASRCTTPQRRRKAGRGVPAPQDHPSQM